MTALPPVIVSVLPALMVRSPNARMSTAGPPDCATLDVMVGCCPLPHPENEWAPASYVGLKLMTVAVCGGV
jgi:hypothetical protein